MSDSDAATLPIPCPDCGELSNELIERVATNDIIPCSLCGGLIDLTAENCRLLVHQAKARIANSPPGG
jgi:uncharacterized Zn finger protein